MRAFRMLACVLPTLLLAPLAAPRAAAEEVEERAVDAQVVRVRDLVPSLAGDGGELEIAPSPAPGSSRLFGRAEIEASLKRAGLESSGKRIPRAVRVVRAFRKLSPSELGELVTPPLVRALRPGVTVTRVEVAREVIVSPHAKVLATTPPEVPRRKGSFRTTVAVEIGEPGESPLRLFVPVVLDVSEQAARADVPRGSRLSLVIREPSLEIQTGGTAMADANVGDVTTVLVTSTGRAVKARVVSAERAEVVDR